MSWERAEPHNCKDGFKCYGHKVFVKYEKVEFCGKMVFSRNATCNRCGESCGTMQIAPHKEHRK